MEIGLSEGTFQASSRFSVGSLDQILKLKKRDGK
jgi:hypothetical protein